MRQRMCKRCGQIFEAEAQQRYCPACRLRIKSESVLRPRICTLCGATFSGYPRSLYCPSCSLERKRKASRDYHRKGASRPLGSTDVCQNCGRPYTVNGALQRYCPECAPSVVRENVNAHKRVYMAEHASEKDARKKLLNTGSLVCCVCGKAFTASSSTSVCSEECASARRKQQQKDADAKRSPRRKNNKGETP